MLVLFFKLCVATLILFVVYLRGFGDCMFGKNRDLYNSMREAYIKKNGEDIWSDDKNTH